MFTSLTQARSALHEGRTSAVELLDTALAEMEHWEPQIHAMVTQTPELARAAAQDADRRLAAGDRGDLLGIPIVLKDLVDVAGVPTTAGSRVLADNMATSDAVVWQRLRAAGAVLLGKANTHEFAYGGTSEPTRHPADTSRMVGGSSGGPAAALAAGYCLGAVGTDTAGSIRNPAGLCGVAGLKPSRGLVDPTGVIPLSPTLDVVGPMARRVADLDPLLSVMSGQPATGDPAPRTPEGLCVGLLSLGPMDDQVLRGLSATQEVLATGGATVEGLELPGCTESVYDDFLIIGFEAVQYHRRWADRRDDYTPYVRSRLEDAETTSETDYQAALERARQLRTAIDQALGQFDVLLLPGVPFTAPPAYDDQVEVAGQPEDRDTALCRNMALANLTGHPVLALPAPADGGLPVGTQLLGGLGSDRDLIRLGGWIESAFGSALD